MTTKTRKTITEALSQKKILPERIQHARAEMQEYLARDDRLVDPLTESVKGGSRAYVASRLQAINDLQQQYIEVCEAIRASNEQTSLTIEGTTRSVANWLVWKRDVFPGQSETLKTMMRTLEQCRKTATEQNRANSRLVQPNPDAKPVNFVANFDEVAILEQIGKLQEVYGQLDGQLSLLNATTFVEY